LVVTLALGRLLPEMQLAVVALTVVTLAVTLLLTLWRFVPRSVPSSRSLADVLTHRGTLRKTAAAAEAHLSRARALGPTSQEGCREILLAVRESITGLETEYDDIVAQTRECINGQN